MNAFRNSLHARLNLIIGGMLRIVMRALLPAGSPSPGTGCLGQPEPGRRFLVTGRGWWAMPAATASGQG
jgi:hypothetical protein